jgi:hypothetical protein
MRVLLYGMQSSGASLVTYFLGQQRGSIALVDVWARHLAPPLAADPSRSVYAKCVITTEFSFEDHRASFRPDVTVLVLREPAQNYRSLAVKDYVSEGGALDEKFRKLEGEFVRRTRFDLTIAYEEFVAFPERVVEALRSAGIPADLDHLRFRRSVNRIRRANFAHDPWCREHFGFGWGFGNVQGTRLDPAKLHRPAGEMIAARVEQLCPRLVEHYRREHGWTGEPPTQPEGRAPGGTTPLRDLIRRMATPTA